MPASRLRESSDLTGVVASEEMRISTCKNHLRVFSGLVYKLHSIFQKNINNNQA